MNMVGKSFGYVLVVVLSCLVLPAMAAAAQNRSIMVTLKANEVPGAQDAGQVSLYGESHALVIGIDDYSSGWPRLSNAVKDARLVARVLEDQGFDVTLKTDLNSADLERALEEFFVLKGMNPQARLFVWFAGHGHTMAGEGYLVPADAPNPAQKGRFKLKALSMRRFGELVRQAESKHALAVFDSCFSGTVFDTGRAMPPPAITRHTTRPVRQYVSSGDANQVVSDDGRFRRLFVNALSGEERADLNQDGYLTGSELGMFLSDRVANLTQNKQTPKYGKLRDDKWDRGDFVFLVAGGPETVSEAPPAPFPAPLYKKSAPEPARLFVDTTPSGAKVRVLNIRPVYYQGMELAQGSYHVEVSAPGYRTSTQWVDLAAGQERRLNVQLKKSAPPAAPARKAQNKNTVLLETFDDNSRNWSIGENEDKRLKIANGRYLVWDKEEKGLRYTYDSLEENLQDLGDYTVEVTMAKTRGPAKWEKEFGLILGGGKEDGKDLPRYYFTVDGAGNYYAWEKADKWKNLVPPWCALDNFTISVDLERIRGVDDEWYGFFFGDLGEEKDGGVRYAVHINGEGRYAFHVREEGKTRKVKDGDSRHIRKGNARNRLTLERNRNQAVLFVNGHLVDTLEIDRIGGKKFGVDVDNRQDLAVHEVSITTIDEKRGQKSHIFYDDFSDNSTDWPTRASQDVYLQVEDGRYYFSHRRNKAGWKSWKTIGGRYSRRLEKGNGENRLGVQVSGNQVQLFVNGNLADQLAIPEIRGSQVGVAVEAQIEAAFDDLHVYKNP